MSNKPLLPLEKPTEQQLSSRETQLKDVQVEQRRGCPILATVFAQECIKSCITTTLLLVAVLTLFYAFGFRPIPV